MFDPQPPSILSYVVAYAGPASMKTVYNWLGPIHNSLNIPYPPLEGKTASERMSVASPTIDGIFVLGKGFVLFDNAPIRFDEEDKSHEVVPDCHWMFGNIQYVNLLILFLLLTYAINNANISIFNPSPYLPKLSPFELGLGS